MIDDDLPRDVRFADGDYNVTRMRFSASDGVDTILGNGKDYILLSEEYVFSVLNT